MRNTVNKVLIGIALFLSVGAFIYTRFSLSRHPQVYINNKEESQRLPQVTCRLKADHEIATVSGIYAQTAYDALLKAGEDNGWEIETKQYDFGVFIESINGKKNTEDRAWIYYVNGTAGSVASDKQELSDGDIVEWSFIKPIY